MVQPVQCIILEYPVVPGHIGRSDRRQVADGIVCICLFLIRTGIGNCEASRLVKHIVHRAAEPVVRSLGDAEEPIGKVRQQGDSIGVICG